MTKEEVIRQAYGECWEQIKDYVDQDGWCNDGGNRMFKEIFEGNGKINKYSSITIFHTYFNRLVNFKNKTGHWRPKSLHGIEHNNGWIKIESEKDLPKTNIEQQNYIANENGIFDFLASNAQIEMKFKNNTCTHYQPIEIPEPPIY